MTNLTVLKTAFLVLSSSMLAVSCDSGSNSGSSQDSTAQISLNITDAPVDEAAAVVVSFSSVTLKGKGELEDQVFEFDEARSIDLMQLQGMQSQSLLDAVTIPAGTYNGMTLGVNAELDTQLDSYITLLDGQSYELYVPSGSESGLKINKSFTVAAGSDGISVADDAIYTIDFDLRKSIVQPPGQLNPDDEQAYFLKPVLRLVQNMQTGAIRGEVAAELLSADNCSDTDPDSGNAVYVYLGADIVPDDIDGEPSEPLTTALVSNSSSYEYEVGYLEAGLYTLAFTCRADEEVDTEDNDLQFSTPVNVEVFEGEVSVIDF